MTTILENGRHIGKWPPYWKMAAILENGSHLGKWGSSWKMAAILEKDQSNKIDLMTTQMCCANFGARITIFTIRPMNACHTLH